MSDKKSKKKVATTSRKKARWAVGECCFDMRLALFQGDEERDRWIGTGLILAQKLERVFMRGFLMPFVYCPFCGGKITISKKRVSNG